MRASRPRAQSEKEPHSFHLTRVKGRTKIHHGETQLPADAAKLKQKHNWRNVLFTYTELSSRSFLPTQFNKGLWRFGFIRLNMRRPPPCLNANQQETQSFRAPCLGMHPYPSTKQHLNFCPILYLHHRPLLLYEYQTFALAPPAYKAQLRMGTETILPTFRERGGGSLIPFLSSSPKRENGTINGIPGVTPLPQFHFLRAGDWKQNKTQQHHSLEAVPS